MFTADLFNIKKTCLNKLQVLEIPHGETTIGGFRGGAEGAAPPLFSSIIKMI